MIKVRNLAGKLVCLLDEATSTVEIVAKGQKTSIQFTEDGAAKVTHEKTK